MKEKKHFLTQEDGESILRIIHKHPLTLVRDMYVSIIVFFVSLVVMLGYFQYGIWYIFVASFIFFIASVVFGFYSFFVWDRDVYILTDRRIIDVEQKSLFSKSQKEAKYEKVQDTHIEISGIFGAIFRYGNLSIQTASETSLTFYDIPDPVSVQKLVTDLVSKSQAEDEEEVDENENNGAMEALKSVIREAIREEKQKSKQ